MAQKTSDAWAEAYGLKTSPAKELPSAWRYRGEKKETGTFCSVAYMKHIRVGD
jgi:hypothetical protein